MKTRTSYRMPTARQSGLNDPSSSDHPDLHTWSSLASEVGTCRTASQRHPSIRPRSDCALLMTRFLQVCAACPVRMFRILRSRRQIEVVCRSCSTKKVAPKRVNIDLSSWNAGWCIQVQPVGIADATGCGCLLGSRFLKLHPLAGFEHGVK